MDGSANEDDGVPRSATSTPLLGRLFGRGGGGGGGARPSAATGAVDEEAQTQPGQAGSSSGVHRSSASPPRARRTRFGLATGSTDHPHRDRTPQRLSWFARLSARVGGGGGGGGDGGRVGSTYLGDEGERVTRANTTTGGGSGGGGGGGGGDASGGGGSRARITGHRSSPDMSASATAGGAGGDDGGATMVLPEHAAKLVRAGRRAGSGVVGGAGRGRRCARGTATLQRACLPNTPPLTHAQRNTTPPLQNKTKHNTATTTTTMTNNST